MKASVKIVRSHMNILCISKTTSCSQGQGQGQVVINYSYKSAIPQQIKGLNLGNIPESSS